jgi:uncharacterized protein (UPF0332 family)
MCSQSTLQTALNKDNGALAKYRMEKAKKCLLESGETLENGRYEASASRSYYAMFHAARSLFAADGLEFKRRSAVFSHFREKYIKTGILPAAMSNSFAAASILRENAEYTDFFVVSKNEVQEQLASAAMFVDEAAKRLRKQIALAREQGADEKGKERGDDERDGR